MKLSRGSEQEPSGNTVNLLSPWVLEAIQLRALRRRFAYGAVLMLMLVAAGWAYQQMSLKAVEKELAAEQDASLTLQQQISTMAPVQTYIEAVGQRSRDVESTMRAQVSFSQVLAALAVAAPRGVTMSSVSVSLLPATDVPVDGAVVTTPTTGDLSGVIRAEATAIDPEDATRGLSGAGCPGPDPFVTEDSIGCMTIEGTATDRETVGRLVSALAAKGAFVEPFISATSTDAIDKGALTFSGTVGLTPEVFTGRYDDLGAALGLQEKP